MHYGRHACISKQTEFAGRLVVRRAFIRLRHPSCRAEPDLLGCSHVRPKDDGLHSGLLLRRTGYVLAACRRLRIAHKFLSCSVVVVGQKHHKHGWQQLFSHRENNHICFLLGCVFDVNVFGFGRTCAPRMTSSGILT